MREFLNAPALACVSASSDLMRSTMAFMRLSNILRRKRGRPEHLKEMPVGNILTVSWFEVEKTAALYGAIGLFHYVLPKKIPADLDGPRSGRSAGHLDAVSGLPVLRVLWFCSDVFGGDRRRTPVFCYLIVPSVGAMLYAENVGPRLAIGWTMGTLVSALGVYLSLKIDLPTGATIVCTFALVLIAMALVRPLIRRRTSGPIGDSGARAQSAREISARISWMLPATYAKSARIRKVGASPEFFTASHSGSGS